MEENTIKKNKTGLLFALLAMLYFTSYMTRLNLSAAKAILIVDLEEFTKSQVGVMGTALFFSYGVGQIISGLLSDKFKPDRIVSIGLIITFACNLILPVTWHSTKSVVLSAIIWGANGLAQSFFWPPIVRLMSKYTDKKGYTKGVWIVSVASYIATLLIYLVVPFEINFIDWKCAFWIPAGLALLVFILWNTLFRVFLKTAEPVEYELGEENVTEKHVGNNSMGKIIVCSGCIFLLVAVAMQGFFKDGLQDWFPTLLAEGFGMDASYATFSNVLLPIFSIVTMSLSTVLFEKVFKNEAKEASVFFVITAVLTGIMIPILKFKISAVLLLVLAGMTNSCLHGINAMFTCFAPRRFSKEDKVATFSGIFNACSYMGGAISSYGIGAIADKIGWTASLFTWLSVCVIGAVMCVISLKKWNNYIK